MSMITKMQISYCRNNQTLYHYTRSFPDCHMDGSLFTSEYCPHGETLFTGGDIIHRGDSISSDCGAFMFYSNKLIYSSLEEFATKSKY